MVGFTFFIWILKMNQSTRSKKINDLSSKLYAKVERGLANGDIKIDAPLNLNSLNLALVEVVYSLMADYSSTTNRVTLGYIKKKGKTNKEESLKDFFDKDKTEEIKRVKEEFVEKDFSLPICWYGVENPFQKRKGARKEDLLLVRGGKYRRADVVQSLHSFLNGKGITTLDELQGEFLRDSNKEFEKSLLGINGIGYVGICYLKMLSGLDTFCKPDKHLKDYILNGKDKTGVGERSIQKIMKNVVALLQADEKHPKLKYLTIRQLDYMIWKSEKKKAKNSEGKKRKCSCLK